MSSNSLPPLDEDGLTNKLLQCLDGEGKPPPGLHPNVADFRARVAEICDREGFNPPFTLELRHERFSKKVEGSITQSDLLLELSFEDPEDHLKSWSAAYLIQAKKPVVGPPGTPPAQTRIRYDKGQLTRIEKLRGLVGASGVKFGFYCRSSLFGASSIAQTFARLRNSFDTDSDDWRSLKTAGVWIGADALSNVGDLLKQAEATCFNLARFVVAHYDDDGFQPDAGTTTKRAQGQSDAASDFLQRICAGNQEALDRLWATLGTDPVDRSDRALRILRVMVRGPGPAPRPTFSSGS